MLSNVLDGGGFPPTLFILPLHKERKKSIYFKDYFGKSVPKTAKNTDAAYQMNDHDIARAKVYLEQQLDIYLAVMVEYTYKSADEYTPEMRIFRWFSKLSGIVSECDNVHELAEYLNVELVELEKLK